MVSNTEITKKGLEKAQLRYEQAKQKLAEEMAKANRFVYRIKDGMLEILSCRGHYEE